jgi:parallel beta-helix repeat protein
VISGFKLVGTNPGQLPSPTINGNRVRILNNDITTNHAGICVLLGSIRGYGTAEDTVIDANRIHNCGVLPANNHQHGLYIESARRSLITNNVIVNNADRGIQMYPDARSSWIARNVIHANGQGIIFSGAEGYASSGNTVVDNIITGSKLRSNLEHYWPSNNPVGTGNSAERNCVHGAKQDNIVTPVVGYRSSRNSARDPQFVRPASGDYRLRRTSPCWHAVPLQSIL